MKKLIILAALMMIACTTAYATTALYSTGFEQGEVPPAFTVGSIEGQDYWHGTSEVTNTDAHTGDQSLAVSMPNGSTQDTYKYYLGGDVDLVHLQFYWKGPKWSTSYSNGYFSDGGTIGMWMYTSGHWNGPIHAYTSGESSSVIRAMVGGNEYNWSYTDWMKVDIWVDVAQDKFAMALDDNLVTQWKEQWGDQAVLNQTWCNLYNPVAKINKLYFAGNPLTNVTYPDNTPFMIDDISVEEGVQMIPEPSTLALLGLVALIARKRS